MPAEPDINQDAVRLELDKILASSQFGASPNLRKFLTYVVGSKLDGTEADLKAYSIAVDALGRPEDFDPQLDPSVRVLAGRVRSALFEYYAKDGVSDPIQIGIPKGSYRPEFTRVDAILDLESKKSSNTVVAEPETIPVIERSVIFSLPFWLAACAIVLLVFAAVSWFDTEDNEQTTPSAIVTSNRISIVIEDENYQNLTPEEIDQVNRFSRELRAALSRNDAIAIFLPPRGSSIDSLTKMDFIVSNSWTPEGESIRVRVELKNARTSALVYSDVRTISRKVSDNLSTVSDAVRSFTRELNSKIFGASIESLRGRDPNTLSAQQLFVLATWVSGPAKNVLNWEKERIALARLALNKDPNFGPAYSVLADKLAYHAAVDGVSNTSEALAEAKSSGVRALELSAGDANVVFNVAQSHWHSGRIGQAVQSMKRVLELDPNHGLAGYFATVNPYTCLRAPDDVLARAVAFDKSLNPDNPVRWVTLTWIGWLHLNRSEFEEALDFEQRAAQIFQIPYSTMRRATVLHMLGRTEEGLDAIREQRRNWPNLSPRHFADVTMPRLCHEFPGDHDMLTFYKSFADASDGKL